MKIEQRTWTKATGWSPDEDWGREVKSPQLVLAFGATKVLENKKLLNSVRDNYPDAHLLGCSTSGEINGVEVYDDSLAITAIQFEHSNIRGIEVNLNQVNGDSFEAGKHLAEDLETDELVHVFVISDGLDVNGSDLVHGLTEHLPEHVAVTGGLAGDADNFDKTFVFLNGDPEEGKIAVIAFYGSRLKIGYGSMGGWDPFGPDRLITRSKDNVLYELDDQSALSLYKKYLGEYADELPSSGLLFPLSISNLNGQTRVVRTILSVDEENQSMTFAGDVPEGVYARLMKANFERLVDGANSAARDSYATIGSDSPELAILVSCVGRKLVLQQRTYEEIESVREALGPETALTGFYSYGEICPSAPDASCELHNQTMTITTFSER